MEMDFSIDKWLEICVDMENFGMEYFDQFKCEPHELTTEKLDASKCTKQVLSSWMKEFSRIYSLAKGLTLSAGKKIEALNSQMAAGQTKVIGLQEELIKCKDDQLASVETTFKKEVATLQTAVTSEFRSWSSVVAQKRETVPTVTPDKLKEAVRSAVVEEDRSRNFIIFNKEENTDEDVAQTVSGVLADLNDKPRIIECRRFGKVQHGRPRPIKVKLTSSDTVYSSYILRKAKCLMFSEENKTTFIGPDRTVEEREVHRTLVEQIKAKAKTEPKLYHFIRRGQIVSVKKNV